MTKKTTTPKKHTGYIPHSSGDTITIKDIGKGATIAAGRKSSAIGQTITYSEVASTFDKWRTELESKIDAQSGLADDDRQDLKQQVGKIASEAVKGIQADPNRLEKLVNTLAIMSKDIFEVAITTLVNPLQGIGLVVKKISDKAKIERQIKTT